MDNFGRSGYQGRRAGADDSRYNGNQGFQPSEIIGGNPGIAPGSRYLGNPLGSRQGGSQGYGNDSGDPGAYQAEGEGTPGGYGYPGFGGRSSGNDHGNNDAVGGFGGFGGSGSGGGGRYDDDDFSGYQGSSGQTYSPARGRTTERTENQSQVNSGPYNSKYDKPLDRNDPYASNQNHHHSGEKDNLFDQARNLLDEIKGSGRGGSGQSGGGSNMF